MAEKVYTPELAEKFIELKTQGLSTLEVAAIFNVARKTIYQWKDDPKKPEFIKAWEIGRDREEAYWERMGREGTQGMFPKFNAVSYIYNMKTRFGGHWKDDGKHNTLSIDAKYENLSEKELNKLIQEKLDKQHIINVLPTNKLEAITVDDHTRQ